MTLRAIVVDDSIIFRKVVRDCLAQIEGITVVDVAKNGKVAIDKIIRHRPDVVTLDVEMPELNGLDVLKALRQANVTTKVIMVSSHTERGAKTTTEALQLGAFDFILKPNHPSVDQNVQHLAGQLVQRVDSIKRSADTDASREPKIATAKLGHQVRSSASTAAASARGSSLTRPDVEAFQNQSARGPLRASAICIGISTGGPRALAEVVPQLPKSLGVPVFVVQHMPPLFTKSMADSLNEKSAVKVIEASDGIRVDPGTVYIAPGGKQMRVGSRHGESVVEVTDDPAIKSCRPSVDYLLGSAAKIYNNRLLAVVMTGMGSDGLDGCRTVKQYQGQVWTQDEASCTVYGMPRQVEVAGLSDQVLSLTQLGKQLAQIDCAADAPTH